MKSDSESIIVYVSIAVIVISLFFIGMEVTGYASSDAGVVNVTIVSSASIVFTTALLDFSNGTVTPSTTAILDSESTVTNWNGAGTSTGLVLENDGNVNVSFTLYANKTAASFIGGTTPAFKVKLSDAEAGSCTGITSNFSTYQAIGNGVANELLACTNFSYLLASDTVNIDVELTINDDATGAKTVGITAVATAV